MTPAPHANRRTRLISLAIFLAGAGWGGLAQGANNASVWNQKVTLQERLGASLQTTLERIATPYDVLVTVQLDMGEQVHQMVRKHDQPGMEMKFGGKKAVKLPGLARTTLPTEGGASPEFSIKVPSQHRVEVERELESWVEKMTVVVWVQEGAPPELVALLKTTATEVSGFDESRGDALEMRDLPERRGQLAARHPIDVAERILWALCGTALLCCLVLAWGLSRGRRSDGTSRFVGELAAASPAGVAPVQTDAEITVSPGEAVALEVGRFAPFAELEAEAQVETLGALSVADLIVVLDQVPVDPDVVRESLERRTAGQRTEVVRGLATEQVFAVTELDATAQRLAGVVEEISSRARIGSAARAADVLAEMSGDALEEALEALRGSHPELAEELRGRLVLFEDLPTLAPESVRQVVAEVKAPVVARALHGINGDVRAAVFGAVSDRLRGFLEAEEEALGEVSEFEVDAARREVERAMRRTHRVAGHS